MFSRQPNVQRVSWFLDQYDAGRLILDPPYQRRSVWNAEYRNYFVDSVVRNYPTQAIFLETETPAGERTRYKVLDGKQRLTTLISFCSDEFETPETVSDLGIGGLYFSDLPAEFSRRVLEYILNVETIDYSTTTDLEQMFNRLNRNTLKLNAQELRNAQFSGKFATHVEGLAENPIWKQVGFATDANIRRMRDVEYVAELYVICLDGIQDGKGYLDTYYADYDAQIPDQSTVDQVFLNTVEYLQSLLSHLDLKRTRFKNVSDFYSLWAALAQLQKANILPKPAEAAMRLARFDEQTNKEPQDRSETTNRYLSNVQQGTNKKPRRATRAEILREVLVNG